jgi:drug/metabolite transporter (DMT)-like permease
MNHTNVFIVFLISIIMIINSIFRQKRLNLDNSFTVLMIESLMITFVIVIITFSLDGYKKVFNDIQKISPRIWKMNIFLSILISMVIFVRYYLMQKLEYSTFRILLLAMSVILYLIAGLIVFNEKLSLKKLIGSVVIIFGIILTAF